MSNHWLMNTSFAYNSTTCTRPARRRTSRAPSASVEDPTNFAARDGYQYDYLTAGSGLGNVYVNAKWLFKVSGMYQLPFDVNVSAFYNARQGYPFERGILSPTPRERRRHGRRAAGPGRERAACRTSRTSTSTSSVRSVGTRVSSRRSTSSTWRTATRSRRFAARRTRRTRTTFRRLVAPRVLRFGGSRELVSSTRRALR